MEGQETTMNDDTQGTNPDPLDDCKKRAHAFIARSESAHEVTLPGWLARKISAYILHLEETNGR
jgi:hypothetical protein